MSDERAIKTYVWHEDKCFFVSTITRDSSCAYYPMSYNETIVWGYDWKNAERGKILCQAGDCIGSIQTHQRIVEALFKHGAVPDDSQDE